MLNGDQVLDALKPIMDPEIGLSIVDLGLIYGVTIEEEGRVVKVDMTLTSPMCPFGPQLVAAAQAAVSQLPGVESGVIQLVWVPRWDPREHASEDAKAFLGFW
jgi:metal-sulfur cluster biosynthetic enzyme